MKRLYAALLCLTVLLGAAAAEPPNFIIILADDVGAAELPMYGNRRSLPNLERLAAQGTTFDICWATPLCIPSRAQLLTGRYGNRTGIRDNKDSLRVGLRSDETTVAELLHDRGYRTAIAGKWSLNRGIDAQVLGEHGFDDFLVWAQFRQNTPAATQPSLLKTWQERGRDVRVSEKIRRYWRPALLDRDGFRSVTDTDYAPQQYGDWMTAWLRARDKQPFLLYYASPLPHIPYHTPPSPCDKQGANLESGLCYLDHNVGRLLDTLEATGLRDNTWILFLGDNGSASDQKGELSPTGVRVPLIVSGPGQVGGRCNWLVDLSDVLPTVAQLAGVPVPARLEIDGVSFADALQGPAPDGGGRTMIASQLADAWIVRSREHLLYNGHVWRTRPRKPNRYRKLPVSPETDAIRDQLQGHIDRLRTTSRKTPQTQPAE